MRCRWMFAAAAAALTGFGTPAYCAADAPSPASVSNPQAVAQVAPGKSTRADVRALFGEPWRVVQFNDCGEAMDDQADETWEYRGRDSGGAYRLHIEFNDNGTVHLIAKIPDTSADGKGTTAKFAPSAPMPGMSM
jgi:SmpA / OmlA family